MQASIDRLMTEPTIGLLPTRRPACPDPGNPSRSTQRTTMRSLVVFLAVLVPSPGAIAQQHEHSTSPYAQLETVEGSSLTPAEIDQLRAGEGMGLALPAELVSERKGPTIGDSHPRTDAGNSVKETPPHRVIRLITRLPSMACRGGIHRSSPRPWSRRPRPIRRSPGS